MSAWGLWIIAVEQDLRPTPARAIDSNIIIVRRFFYPRERVTEI